jgi:hypothetical protein
MFRQTRQDLAMAKEIMTRPYAFFRESKSGADVVSVVRYYLVLSVLLAILTPVVNMAGFPSDVVHASTNAQMAAYKYAPVIEQYVGLSRHVWTGMLTVVFMGLKLPFFVLFYHVVAKLLGGTGSWLASLKLTVYPATPAMLFGWVPYSDFIFGLWVGFFLVPAFHYCHEIPWGKATAFVTVLMGLQILYVVLSGGGWLIEP